MIIINDKRWYFEETFLSTSEHSLQRMLASRRMWNRWKGDKLC